MVLRAENNTPGEQYGRRTIRTAVGQRDDEFTSIPLKGQPYDGANSYFWFFRRPSRNRLWRCVVGKALAAGK